MFSSSPKGVRYRGSPSCVHVVTKMSNITFNLGKLGGVFKIQNLAFKSYCDATIQHCTQVLSPLSKIKEIQYHIVIGIGCTIAFSEPDYSIIDYYTNTLTWLNLCVNLTTLGVFSRLSFLVHPQLLSSCGNNNTRVVD